MKEDAADHGGAGGIPRVRIATDGQGLARFRLDQRVDHYLERAAAECGVRVSIAGNQYGRDRDSARLLAGSLFEGRRGFRLKFFLEFEISWIAKTNSIFGIAIGGKHRIARRALAKRSR